jgi:putative phage-type endonuclease
LKRAYNTLNMTEAEWLAHRLKGIGGSDVATILGMNPYKSALRLYMEKTGELEPEMVDNEFVELGKELEPVLRKLFTKRTGYKVNKNNFILQHDTHEFMLANVDGEVLHPEKGRGILEIKTTSEWNRGEWDSEKVPTPYMLQVQHYLAVSGYDFGYICVLIGGNKFRYWLVERDEELIEMLISAEQSFWENVQNRIPPDIDGHTDTKELLNSIYTPDEIVDEPMQLDHNLIHDIEQIEDIKQKEKELKEQKTFYENRIKKEMGEHEKAMVTENGTNYNVSFKFTNPKKSFDTKSFALDHPELHKEYVKEGKASRRFTISAKGE